MIVASKIVVFEATRMRDHMSIVEVIEALKQLDPQNDAHWTEEGFPRLDVMQDLLLGVTRELIREAAPKFSRKTPALPDYEAVRNEKLQAVKAAEQILAEAQEGLKDANAAYMESEKPFIVRPDPHQRDRQMRKWLQGQQADAMQRHERGKYIDGLIRDAGGPRSIGAYPIDTNMAARGKAARKARSLQIPKTNG